MHGSSYQRQTSASGPTTLGELSGLADLKRQLEEQEDDASGDEDDDA